MRKIVNLVAASLLVFGCIAGTTACGGQEKTPEIALVTDVGNIDDKSFNQGTWEGVKEYAETNKIGYAYYRPSEDSTAARVETIKTAIDKGAKMVVCPGYLFETAIFEIQDQYPSVNFLLLDGQPNNGDYSNMIYKTGANVHNILYKEEQAGYFAGYAAVKDGYTKLGFLGGMSVPAVIRYGYGYVQGAEDAAEDMGLANGAITMKYNYAGSFSPSEDLRIKMDGWYTAGTEVVFSSGGGIYLSVTGSAEAANKKVIGVDVDQVAESNTIISSAMKELATSTKLALTSFYGNGQKWDAEHAGKTVTLGAAEGCVGLPTVATSWKFTNYKVADYEALFNKVVAGTIVIDDSSDPAVYPQTVKVVVDYNA